MGEGCVYGLRCEDCEVGLEGGWGWVSGEFVDMGLVEFLGREEGEGLEHVYDSAHVALA